jgi:malate dehydrogenase (quinone)
LIDSDIAVQAIKKEDGDEGIVHFGTEVATTADKSISFLLGASPGASVCLNIVLEVIHKCFPALYQSQEGQNKLKEMIPTFDLDLGSIKETEEIAQYQKWSQSAEESLELRG